MMVVLVHKMEVSGCMKVLSACIQLPVYTVMVV